MATGSARVSRGPCRRGHLCQAFTGHPAGAGAGAQQMGPQHPRTHRGGNRCTEDGAAAPRNTGAETGAQWLGLQHPRTHRGKNRCTADGAAAPQNTQGQKQVYSRLGPQSPKCTGGGAGAQQMGPQGPEMHGGRAGAQWMGPQHPRTHGGGVRWCLQEPKGRDSNGCLYTLVHSSIHSDPNRR